MVREVRPRAGELPPRDAILLVTCCETLRLPPTYPVVCSLQCADCIMQFVCRVPCVPQTHRIIDIIKVTMWDIQKFIVSCASV